MDGLWPEFYSTQIWTIGKTKENNELLSMGSFIGGSVQHCSLRRQPFRPLAYQHTSQTPMTQAADDGLPGTIPRMRCLSPTTTMPTRRSTLTESVHASHLPCHSWLERCYRPRTVSAHWLPPELPASSPRQPLPDDFPSQSGIT